jgi:hypothetical protein
MTYDVLKPLPHGDAAKKRKKRPPRKYRRAAFPYTRAKKWSAPNLSARASLIPCALFLRYLMIFIHEMFSIFTFKVFFLRSKYILHKGLHHILKTKTSCTLI